MGVGVIMKQLSQLKPIVCILVTQLVITSPLIWWGIICSLLCKMCEPLRYLIMIGGDLANGRSPGTQPRTVLVTGGGHGSLALVRSLYRAGMRVVVVEVDDTSTMKFSGAAATNYTVSPPELSPQTYVRRLVEIAMYENAKHFIPGSDRDRVMYDAMAKAPLERIGCRCFVPSAQAIKLLQDPTTLEKVAREAGLSTTPLHPVTHPFHVQKLYDKGVVGQNRPLHIMMSIEDGKHGRPDELELPDTAEEFMEASRCLDISATHAWIVRRRVGGERLVVAALVHDNRIMSIQVTTRSRGRVEFITCSCLQEYVQTLLRRLPLSEPITGNLVFYFVRCRLEGKFYPRSCDVGGLPLQDEVEKVTQMTYLHRRQRSGEGKNGLIASGLRRNSFYPDLVVHKCTLTPDITHSDGQTECHGGDCDQDNVSSTTQTEIMQMPLEDNNTPEPPQLEQMSISCSCPNNKSLQVVYWLPREIGRLVAQPSMDKLMDCGRILWKGRDVFCDTSDPWPVVWLYLVKSPMQMVQRAMRHHDMTELDISNSEFQIY